MIETGKFAVVDVLDFGPSVAIGSMICRSHSMLGFTRAKLIVASDVDVKKVKVDVKKTKTRTEELRREIEKMAKEVLEITEEIDPDVPLHQYGLTSNTAISLGSK